MYTPKLTPQLEKLIAKRDKASADARACERKIERLMANDRAQERAAMLGKCFQLANGSYFRCEYFIGHNPHGTLIQFTERDEHAINSHQLSQHSTSIYLNVNEQMWEMKGGKNIHPNKFKTLLIIAKKQIKI